MEKVVILNKEQIARKLKRMAYEIWEMNSSETAIEIVGIEGGGVIIAKALINILREISPLDISFSSLSLDKRNPLSTPIHAAKDFTNKNVIIVDDVANSGKTLMYALKPFLEVAPRKVLIAVLVDRKHKNFPVIPDIIGYSLATTLQDMILVNYEGETLTSAHVE